MLQRTDEQKPLAQGQTKNIFLMVVVKRYVFDFSIFTLSSVSRQDRHDTWRDSVCVSVMDLIGFHLLTDQQLDFNTDQ